MPTKEFGVSITPNLTYGQLGSLLDEAEWAQPANAEQTELCERQEKGSGLFFERDLVSSLGTES